jgi:tetratricopeptide (TPR) repeat protein
LDAFQLAFPAKREVGFWEIEWNATPSKAHNELLHILATQGLVGIAAVAVLLWGSGRAIFRVWRQEESRPFLIALMAGMVGFGIQDSFSFTVVGFGTLFITMTAVLQRLELGPLALPGDLVRRSPSRGQPAALLILRTGIIAATAALIYWGVVRPWIANRDCGRAEALLETSPEEAILLAEHALNLDGTKEMYWVQLGAACEKAAWSARNPTIRRDDLNRARHAFEHAARMVPVSAYNHANLGRVLGELSESANAASAEAFAEFDVALGLDPTNVYFYADAGLTAVRLGDYPHARAYAERGLALQPNFAPLHAQLGYVAIIEHRWPDAVAQLNEALAGEWYGDDVEHRRAALALGALHESLRCAPAHSE